MMADGFYGCNPYVHVFPVLPNNDNTQPLKFDSGLAFMFETCYTLKLTDWALSATHLEQDYVDCWSSLPKLFDEAKAKAANASASK